MTLPASGQKWLDTLETMRATIAELAAERDRYRDALVARHGGEPIALLSELDEARAEAEKLRADLQAMTVEAMRAGRELDAVKRQRDELVRIAKDAHTYLIDGGHADESDEIMAGIEAASQPAQPPKPEGGVS